MNTGEGKAEVSLSNEFFKKLNQQIVQKDNLIKLLQLQIKNLKTQIADLEKGGGGAADGGESARQLGDLGKQLEAKESEIKGLKDDLAQDRDRLNGLLGQKEEQIKSLTDMLEDYKRKLADGAQAPAGDSAELQAQVEDYQRRLKDAERKVMEMASEAAQREAEMIQQQSRLAEIEGQSGATAEVEALKAQLAELDSVRAKAAAAEQLQAQLAEAEAAKMQAAGEIEVLRAKAAEAEALAAKVAELETQMVPATDVDLLRAKVAEIPALEEKLRLVTDELAKVQAAPIAADQSQRVLELEQDIATLKELLAEKDQQIAVGGGAVATAPSPDPALQLELETAKAGAAAAKLEVDAVRSQLETANGNLAAATTKLASLEAEAGSIAELREKIANLESASRQAVAGESAHAAEKAALQAQIDAGAAKLAEAAAGLDAAKAALIELDTLKSRVVELEGQLDKAQESVADEDILLALQTENKRLSSEITGLQVKVSQGHNEIQDLQNQLAAAQAAAARGPADSASQAEVEKLTQQVADQLLAIQKLEDRTRAGAEALALKDQEIVSLRQQLTNSGARSNDAIPLPADGEIVSNFIDFFDGLDTFLLKNPIPELQTLHHKLLERLIKPNQIEYLPVIAEEFDPAKHVATDYFRSKRFPEKCIVFEVEKGYRKGEQVVKKPKVWVVQNVFNCQSCAAPQTHEDSRFCFKCGVQLMAPNNLPLDHLPLFEPTVTTFLKFGERMLDRGEVGQARLYLQEGLGLDGNYVPILVRLADVLSMESDFAGALELLKKASQIKTDPRILEKLRDLEVKNTIFQQARALNLSPDKFEELRQLIQK